MNYTLDKKKKLIMQSAVMSILLFFGLYRVHYTVPGLYEHIGSCIVYPFLKIHSLVVQPIAYALHAWRSDGLLRQKLDAVTRERDALRAENTALKGTQLFADDIQELVAFKKRYAQDAMLVSILGTYCSAEEHYAYVDCGALSGATTHMIALYNNNLVGRVVAVYPWYSKIQLITDPLCRVSVAAASTGICGVYAGTGDTQQAVVHNVDHMAVVRVGDDLMSTGDGLVYPRGYRVGTVTAVMPNGLYKTVSAAPAIDVCTLKICLLLGVDCGKKEKNQKNSKK